MKVAPRVTICKGKRQWKTIMCSELGHRLCTLVLAGHLRTDSLCWARCVALTLCNRSPRRLWTVAGTSCRGCRPEAPAVGRVAHGQLGSSEPVDGPSIRRWFLPAPPLPCTVLRGPIAFQAQNSRVLLLPETVLPGLLPSSVSSSPYSSPARFSPDLLSVR